VSVDELRSTPQRRAVLDVVHGADDHPTAAEVLERVLDVLPGVGAATVYRSLSMLVESGQILELRLGASAAARYDRNIEHHDHLVCDRCGRLSDVQAGIDHGNLLVALREHDNFQVSGYDLRIHGVCADCSPPTRSQRSPCA
jgi:Fur family ferric uptake transcriptional regulator/Fur family peroxide stress response transcriptional regulator